MTTPSQIALAQALERLSEKMLASKWPEDARLAMWFDALATELDPPERAAAPERKAAQEVPVCEHSWRDGGVHGFWCNNCGARQKPPTPTETPPPARQNAEKIDWGQFIREFDYGQWADYCDAIHARALMRGAYIKGYTEGQRAALVLPELPPAWWGEWCDSYIGGQETADISWEDLRTHLSPPAKGADQ